MIKINSIRKYSKNNDYIVIGLSEAIDVVDKASGEVKESRDYFVTHHKVLMYHAYEANEELADCACQGAKLIAQTLKLFRNAELKLTFEFEAEGTPFTDLSGVESTRTADVVLPVISKIAFDDDNVVKYEDVFYR